MTYSIQTKNGHLFLTAENIQDAKDWARDCTWSDMESDDSFNDLTDPEIIYGIARHFDGGWDGFLASY
jgi:hypothetical protein